MSSEAASLLRGLLQREPPKRLGYGPRGSDDVMAHAFFRHLSWARLLRREMPSPFRPSVNHVDRRACLRAPYLRWFCDVACLSTAADTCMAWCHAWHVLWALAAHSTT
jgi:hypothetical protein